jgi:hypothetical protein
MRITKPRAPRRGLRTELLAQARPRDITAEELDARRELAVLGLRRIVAPRGLEAREVVDGERGALGIRGVDERARELERVEPEPRQVRPGAEALGRQRVVLGERRPLRDEPVGIVS